MLPFDVWDILVAEQPSSDEGILLFGLDHVLILKARIVNIGSSAPLGWIVCID
jgi:hypothetical protein